MTVDVLDPLGAAADPALPTIGLALDPARAQRKLRHLVRLTGPGGVARLRAIRVTRHKPGRRCVIEYDVDGVSQISDHLFAGRRTRLSAPIGTGHHQRQPG